MRNSRRLIAFRNAAAPFAAAFIVVVFGALTWWSAVREGESVRRVERTHLVLRTSTQVLLGMLNAETGVRGYVISWDSTFLEPYRYQVGEVKERVKALQSLSKDDPAQDARTAVLSGLVDRRFASFDNYIALRKSTGVNTPRPAAERHNADVIRDSMRQVLGDFRDAEMRKLDAHVRDVARHQRSVLWIVSLGTLVAAVIATVINVILSRYAATQGRLTEQLHLRARDLENLNHDLKHQAEELERQAVELEQQAVELEMLNERLEERTAGAEHANEAKAKFLATISHDLRTPLTAMIGYANLIELGVRGPVTEAQLKDLRGIQRSGQHLLALINDVVGFAKIEAGHIHVHIEEVDVRAVLSGVEAMVAPQIAAKGLHFESDDCDASERVLADREKLDEILVNLVTNAIKFTPRGGTIRIECNIADGWVRLAVRDTGPGIPADRLESIFAPFVQLNGDTAPAQNHGVGLGLAISRELARAMNGELTVQSILGKGSTFTLRLPRRIAQMRALDVDISQQSGSNIRTGRVP